MSNLKYDIEALRRSTHYRLLSINKTIREVRKLKLDIFDNDKLTYYKSKRKETDQLLSKINILNENDLDSFNKLKECYLTFQID
jgi:mannose/fructose/N-acetylgalactosamine-specific phosphotransferase system component IIB